MIRCQDTYWITARSAVPCGAPAVAIMKDAAGEWAACRTCADVAIRRGDVLVREVPKEEAA